MGTVPGAAGRLLRRAQTRRLGANGGGVITRTVLPGGLRVVTEAMPGVRSASVGVWVPVGSRDETPRWPAPATSSSTCCSRAPPRRSALDIASAMDAVGGEFNAFTEKEHTCFYATVLDRDLPLAVDIVMRRRAATRPSPRRTSTSSAAWCSKRSRCATTTRPTWCTTSSPAALFGDTPLGRPILGTVDSITALTRAPDRRLLPAPLHAGRHGGVRRRQRRPRATSCGWCGARSATASAGRASRARRGTPRRTSTRCPPSRCECWPTTPSRRTSCSAVTACRATTRAGSRSACCPSALGGGMSSRLFQRSASERGLAYSVYSFSSMLRRRPASSAYTPGASPSKADEVLGLMRDRTRRRRQAAG